MIKSNNNNEVDSMASLMRDDWERRISHDYLGWMNDRVVSDAELILTGQRDCIALLDGLEPEFLRSATVLELGCGVGRIMREMAKRCSRIVGTDISAFAIEKARQMLSGFGNSEVNVGNGKNLDGVQNGSFDFVYSFGVLTNVPVLICAGYCLEIARVLKDDGLARLLFFVGHAEPTVRNDTVAYRSFERKNLELALQNSGLQCVEASIFTAGVEIPESSTFRPELWTVRKKAGKLLTAQQIEQMLVPGGEAVADNDWPGSYTEYLLSVIRAGELLKAGNMKQARDCLEFAIRDYKAPHPDLLALKADLDVQVVGTE